MKRRNFIALLGGAATTWPLSAWAQPDRTRRIGVLMNTAAENVEGRAGVGAFQQVLQQLSWTPDRNVQIETRWGANDLELNSRYAADSRSARRHARSDHFFSTVVDNRVIDLTEPLSQSDL